MDNVRSELLALDWGWLDRFTQHAPLTRARLALRFAARGGDDLPHGVGPRRLPDPAQPRLVQRICFDSGVGRTSESRDAALFHQRARRLLVGVQRERFDALCGALFSPLPAAQPAAERLLATRDPVAARIPPAEFPRVLAPAVVPRLFDAVAAWRQGWAWQLAAQEADTWAEIDAHYASLRSGRRGPVRCVEALDSVLLAWERALKRLARAGLGGVVSPPWANVAYRLVEATQRED